MLNDTGGQAPCAVKLRGKDPLNKLREPSGSLFLWTKIRYDDEKETDGRATGWAPVAQDGGRPGDYAALFDDGDGGTGTALRADGEADQELCVLREYGERDAEVRVDTVAH